ncbi:MAG: phosphoenolpyruvate--protein phosphotransferase [Verrucomicrobiales bacterium]
MNEPRRAEEVHIRGLGVSPGLAVGRVHFHRKLLVEPILEAVAPELADAEWERFQRAVAQTKEQLQRLLDRAADDAGAEQAGIFEAHLLMAEDPSLVSEVERGIRRDHLRAEGAFYRVMEHYMAAMRKFDDAYLRDRVTDLDDVTRRVLANLRGETKSGEVAFEHVLLAHDLAPSETMEMDPRVLGFATEAGSPTSHTAILARSLGIPAVVGLHDVHSHVRPDDIVLLDGAAGVLIVNPTRETIATYESARRRRARVDSQLYALREGEAVTRDGRRILVAANIELADEIDAVMGQGAEGVGLYRTEFLFLNQDFFPSEDRQAADYTAAARGAGEHGIIIRTLDIGGDKMPADGEWETEGNPFLGWRGIRRSLQQPDLFRTQLRAILRASAHGRVRLMYPLVSGVEEVRQANALLAACMNELAAEGVPFDRSIARGAMIEVPSAAVIADLLAEEVDFFSVGTNDLIQYSIAVDRVNERVAELYQPCHPAIVRLLRHIVQAAEPAGLWVGVCGEMAGDIVLTPLLVGLGFTELSVGASQIPRVKHAIRTLDSGECRELVTRALGLRHHGEILARSRQMARSYYAELLQ